MGETFKKRLSVKKNLLTGLLVCAPLAVVMYLVRLVDGVLDLLPTTLQPQTYLPFKVPGLGIILTVLLIYLVGLVSSNMMGRAVVAAYEGLLALVPGVRWAYNMVKQFLEGIMKLSGNDLDIESPSKFNGVVLVKYPHERAYALAFRTGDATGETQERTAETLVNVFVPTTPNPTSGFFLLFPQKEVIELDMSIEQAFRLIISAGMAGEKKASKEKTDKNKTARPT